MKRKIEVGLLALIVCVGIGALLLTYDSNNHVENPSIQTGKEITIRNVTKYIVHYRIKTYNSSEVPQRKRLEKGAIHSYSSQAPLVISYQLQGAEVKHNLTPGMPYSFRYDENNQIQIYEGSHGRLDAADLAPFVTTPMEVVEKMLELASVDRTDIVYDIGCGDGRIVIAAAKKCGAQGVGIDIDPRRIKESRNGAINSGVDSLVRFYLGDALNFDISEATIVTLYLLPESNELLRPKFEKELKPGTRVVSHDYHIPGWEEKERDVITMQDAKGKDHTIFLYKR